MDLKKSTATLDMAESCMFQMHGQSMACLRMKEQARCGSAAPASAN